MAGQEINEALISKIINRMYSEGVDSDDVGSGIPGLQPAKPPQPGLSDDVPEVSATEDSSAQEYGDDVHRSVHTVPLLEEHGLDKDGLPDRAADQDIKMENVQESILKDVPTEKPGVADVQEDTLLNSVLKRMEGFTVLQAAPETDMDRQDDSLYFAPKVPTRSGTFDVERIRKDFPLLSRKVRGKPLIWLDNAATSQKPFCVIDKLKKYYEEYNSNVHRGAHDLAAEATDAYEGARRKVRDFIGARSVNEIVFVRGATEAVNLVAQTYGRQNIGPGDEILITELEHHANIVPWQMICKEKGALLKVAPINDAGEIILEEFAALLGPKTRIVGIGHVSNALGTVNPVAEMIEMAHSHGAVVLLDGAQSVPHMRVNVAELDCDFFAFSGHKIFAPTGIGVLYGKEELLKSMPPWQGGGSMIKRVTKENATYQDPPHKFEAGTGNIADAVGLGAALDYLHNIGFEQAAAHEEELLQYATAKLSPIPGVRLIGTARKKVGVISLLIDGHSVEDVGKRLNEEGIAVRASHHCAQLVMQRFGTEATVRPSFAFYNTFEEVDKLAETIKKIAEEGQNA